MPRHAGNRTEIFSQGAAQAKRTSAFTMLESAVGVKPCNPAGNMRPACPGAETRQCTDQAEPVWGVRSLPVSRLAQPGRRARHRSSRFHHLPRDLRVGRLRGPGEAIRVLPLGDPVHRSPSSQYPAPAGSDWTSDAGPTRRPGPRTGSRALTAPPARMALATDSVRDPQRSRTEWGTPNRGQAGVRRRQLTQVAGCRVRPPASESPARRVIAPPAIKHTVPAW